MVIKRIFVFLMISLVMKFSVADELKPFKFEEEEKSVQSNVCKVNNLKLPKNYVVLAASTYAGRKLGFRIDKIGFEATQVDVAVNFPDAPVVILLGAYNPVIWNIGWIKKTKIVAVVATGYYKQSIAGLDKSVPTLISTYDNKNPCGYFFKNDYNSSANSVNKVSQSLFDKDINILYPVTNGKVLLGKSVAEDSHFITSAENTPEKYYESAPVLKGSAAIDSLLKNSYIRQATVEELLKMPIGISENFLTQAEVYQVKVEGESPQRVLGYRSNKRAYIVMKTFVYPPDLNEKGITLFLTPKGVTPPSGSHENAVVIDENEYEPPTLRAPH